MSENLPPLDFGDLNHEVRIWDLDETLIILSSLLTTQFSAAHKESSTLCNYLGREMMKFLFIILEEFFAFKELEDHNITNFENLDYTNTIDNTSCLPDPVKKNVQELYIRNKEFYDNNRNYIQFEFVPEEIRTPLSAVYEEIDSLSSSWLSISYLILEKSQTCTNVTNLVVTSSHILGALAKLLLFKLINKALFFQHKMSTVLLMSVFSNDGCFLISLITLTLFSKAGLFYPYYFKIWP
jgi:hypothetical protein